MWRTKLRNLRQGTFIKSVRARVCVKIQSRGAFGIVFENSWFFINIFFHNTQKSLTIICLFIWFGFFWFFFFPPLVCSFCCFLLTLVMFHPLFFHPPVCNQLLHATKGWAQSKCLLLAPTNNGGWVADDWVAHPSGSVQQAVPPIPVLWVGSLFGFNNTGHF